MPHLPEDQGSPAISGTVVWLNPDGLRQKLHGFFESPQLSCSQTSEQIRAIVTWLSRQVRIKIGDCRLGLTCSVQKYRTAVPRRCVLRIRPNQLVQHLQSVISPAQLLQADTTEVLCFVIAGLKQ